MKIALGTAQFGLAYGIANPQPQISYLESQAILDYAFKRGVSMLDTAIGYGDCETRLGKIGVQPWGIISKLPEVPQGVNAASWIHSSVKDSLERLNIKCLYGLLLHRPSQLQDSNGGEIYAALQKLKSEGLVLKIGVSIYSPSELDGIFSVGDVDIVQSPLSVFDRRIITSGWLERLGNRGTEIHARSVFLQGLLLMSPSARPQKFDRWSESWEQYQNWLDQADLSPLEASLGYVLGIPQIHRVVIGVNSLNHISEILSTKIKEQAVSGPKFVVNDEELLNPLSWIDK